MRPSPPRKVISGILALLAFAAPLQARSAAEWVEEVDRNMVMDAATYRSRMVVHYPDGVERVFEMRNRIMSDRFALVEYTEPKREQGTRYLKRDDQLWIYFPRQDRTMQIQGHMLREGVQGGDMSFEDMTESRAWHEVYSAEIVREGADTVVVRLEADDMSVSYPVKVLTIARAKALPVTVENRDASGELIKTMHILESERFGERWFPTVSEIRSGLVEDKWTRFEIMDLNLDADLDEEMFTKRALTR
jgi:hypothetical protein